MKDLKGIVVDIQDRKGAVIVLTPDGDIVEVLTNGQKFRIGDEILFYEKVIEPKKGVRWNYGRTLRYASGFAAALVLFFANPFSISDLGLGKKLFDQKDAYAATMFIESKKSNLKVKVNKDQEVMSAEALNKPTKTVLKGVGSGDENIDEFLDAYFEEAKESGYLNPNEPIIISVDPAPALGPEKTDLLKKIETVSRENNVTAVAVPVPDTVIKKAVALGVTPGKLVISLVAKATGQVIPLDTLKTATVTELINTVPNVVEVLPTFTETQLAQLAQNATDIISTPEKEDSATKTATAVNQPASNKTETSPTSSTTNPQPSADSSEPVKSDPAESAGGASSSAQPQEQTQPQEESAQPTENEQQPDPQQKTPENQTQESQPQENQTQEDQTQEDQAPENQIQDQPQAGQTQQEDQSNKDQGQQNDQGQDSQTQDKQTDNNDSDEKDPGLVATILGSLKDVLG